MLIDTIQLIFQSIAAALAIRGLWTIFETKPFFNHIRGFIGSKLPCFINEPLWCCVICMSSTWGTAIFFSFCSLKIVYLPLYVLCIAGIQSIISNVLDRD